MRVDPGLTLKPLDNSSNPLLNKRKAREESAAKTKKL